MSSQSHIVVESSAGDGAGPIQRGDNAYAFAFLARALRAAGRIAILTLATRLFGISDVGDFAYFLAIGALVGCLADLGLSEYVGREVPARGLRAPSLVRTATRLRLAGLLPATLFGWLIAALSTGSDDISIVGSIAYGCAAACTDFVAAVRRAHGRYDREALECGLAAIGPLVLVVVALAIPTDASAFSTFQLVLGGSALLIAALRLRKILGEAGVGVHGDEASPTVATVAASRWFWARGLLAWATMESVPVFIQALSTNDQVAIFASAMRPVGLVSNPFIALGWVFAPSLAHDLALGREYFPARVREMNLLCMTLMPAGLAGALLGGLLLLHGFGEAYLVAVPTLVVLAVAHMIYFGTLNGIPVMTVGKERNVALGQIVTLITLSGLLVLLVPTSGARGGAFAVAGALVVSKLLNLFFYLHEGIPTGGWRHGLLLGAIGGWAALCLAVEPPWSFVLLASGGAASAIVSAVLLRRTVLFRGRTAAVR